VNARALEQEGAAVVLEESNLSAAWLVDTVAALLEDPGRLARMSAAASKLAHPEAVRKISEMAVRLASNEQPVVSSE
jgi:UDP-N-acetylglucosamine--N-acetylmuramyl-(pentapeptide) pyrophosphoryl-undecaprenol N-acetylglucosamine transferase